MRGVRVWVRAYAVGLDAVADEGRHSHAAVLDLSVPEPADGLLQVVLGLVEDAQRICGAHTTRLESRASYDACTLRVCKLQQATALRTPVADDRVQLYGQVLQTGLISNVHLDDRASSGRRPHSWRIRNGGSGEHHQRELAGQIMKGKRRRNMYMWCPRGHGHRVGVLKRNSTLPRCWLASRFATGSIH